MCISLSFEGDGVAMSDCCVAMKEVADRKSLYVKKDELKCGNIK